MSSMKVLVVFYSRYGAAERLALAAGVGAIEARANIRLRRLADVADQKTIDADPAWKEGLARMQRDYVAPRPADPVWADVIVLVSPADSAVEVEAYCASLAALGPMTGKIAAPLAVGHSDTALRPVYDAAACAGLIVVPPEPPGDDAVAAARAFGQRVTQMARALAS